MIYFIIGIAVFVIFVFFGGLPSTILEPLPDGSCRVIREGAIPLAALAFDGVDLRHMEESGLLRY